MKNESFVIMASPRYYWGGPNWKWVDEPYNALGFPSYEAAVKYVEASFTQAEASGGVSPFDGVTGISILPYSHACSTLSISYGEPMTANKWRELYVKNLGKQEAETKTLTFQETWKIFKPIILLVILNLIACTITIIKVYRGCNE